MEVMARRQKMELAELTELTELAELTELTELAELTGRSRPKLLMEEARSPTLTLGVCSSNDWVLEQISPGVNFRVKWPEVINCGCKGCKWADSCQGNLPL